MNVMTVFVTPVVKLAATPLMRPLMGLGTEGQGRALHTGEAVHRLLV